MWFGMWPEEGDHLEFDGHTVKLCDKNGFLKKSWEATSGVLGSGPQDQGKRNYGPIPEGTYEVNPKEIQYVDWYSPADWLRFWGDWGKTRIPLIATPETKEEQLSKRVDRWGFYFHGGEEPGTIGCIDLGAEEEDFFNTLEQYEWKLELEVDYSP